MNYVFTIREGEWQARVGGKVLPTIWNSKGAALAGMKTEMLRAERRAEHHAGGSAEGVRVMCGRQ